MPSTGPQRVTEVYVPADYEYLDPERPEVGYEADLSPEHREQMRPMREEKALRLDKHRRRVKEEYGLDIGPPWTIKCSDGTQITVGEGGRGEGHNSTA